MFKGSGNVRIDKTAVNSSFAKLRSDVNSEKGSSPILSCTIGRKYYDSYKDYLIENPDFGKGAPVIRRKIFAHEKLIIIYNQSKNDNLFIVECKFDDGETLAVAVDKSGLSMIMGKKRGFRFFELLRNTIASSIIIAAIIVSVAIGSGGVYNQPHTAFPYDSYNNFAQSEQSDHLGFLEKKLYGDNLQLNSDIKISDVDNAIMSSTYNLTANTVAYERIKEIAGIGSGSLESSMTDYLDKAFLGQEKFTFGEIIRKPVFFLPESSILSRSGASQTGPSGKMTGIELIKLYESSPAISPEEILNVKSTVYTASEYLAKIPKKIVEKSFLGGNAGGIGVIPNSSNWAARFKSSVYSVYGAFEKDPDVSNFMDKYGEYAKKYANLGNGVFNIVPVKDSEKSNGFGYPYTIKEIWSKTPKEILNLLEREKTQNPKGYQIARDMLSLEPGLLYAGGYETVKSMSDRKTAIEYKKLFIKAFSITEKQFNDSLLLGYNTIATEAIKRIGGKNFNETARVDFTVKDHDESEKSSIIVSEIDPEAMTHEFLGHLSWEEYKKDQIKGSGESIEDYILFPGNYPHSNSVFTSRGINDFAAGLYEDIYQGNVKPTELVGIPLYSMWNSYTKSIGEEFVSVYTPLFLHHPGLISYMAMYSGDKGRYLRMITPLMEKYLIDAGFADTAHFEDGRLEAMEVHAFILKNENKSVGDVSISK